VLLFVKIKGIATATEAVNIPTKTKIAPVNRLAVLSSKNKQTINVVMKVKIARLLPVDVWE